MSEMMKRAAQAVYDESMNMDPMPLDICAIFARAVIRSLREPTKSMIDAGAVYAEYAVEAAWKEMIDTALKDDQ